MIDCGPADDVCLIQNQIAAEIAPAADEFFVNARSISIGEFNGRTYAYTWFGGMPTIVISDIDKTPFSDDALVSDVPDEVYPL